MADRTNWLGVEAGIDEQVLEMCRTWDSPVGEVIDEIVDEGASVAKSLAPVSSRGSKYSKPGNLKALTGRSADPHRYSSNGTIFGMVVSPSYPAAFVSPWTTDTRQIRNQWGGPYGVYHKSSLFMVSAVQTMGGIWS